MAKTEKDQPVEKFVRLVDVTRPTDQHPAWQAETIHIQGTKILKRELVGKPDMWGMAYAFAQDLLDPRSA